MCRLLGIVASRRAALAELLDDDLTPFLGLACDHPDGWGISYAGPTDRIVVSKEPGRADQSARFGALVDCTVTDAALLHLRLASPPRAITVANTHPFGDALSSFAHNGRFAPADSLDRELGAELIAAAAGDTDSERFYLAIRRRIDDGMAPATAIHSAAAEIRALAEQWDSLNCLLLTPKALYAYADHDPDSEVIGRRGPHFFDLSYRVDPGQVVVASTGWAQPPGRWHRLPERHTLEIRRRDLLTTIHEGLTTAPRNHPL